MAKGNMVMQYSQHIATQVSVNLLLLKKTSQNFQEVPMSVKITCFLFSNLFLF